MTVTLLVNDIVKVLYIENECIALPQNLVQVLYPSFLEIVALLLNSMARRIRNPQVLILKRIIKAFLKVAHSYKGIGYALSSKKARYFTMKDDVSCSALPTDVPKGHCAVYVGSHRSRFVIPTTYLNHSLFRVLLEKAEEEYGFDHQMGLTIPCEEVAFHDLTSMLAKKDVVPATLRLDEFLHIH